MALTWKNVNAGLSPTRAPTGSDISRAFSDMNVFDTIQKDRAAQYDQGVLEEQQGFDRDTDLLQREGMRLNQQGEQQRINHASNMNPLNVTAAELANTSTVAKQAYDGKSRSLALEGDKLSNTGAFLDNQKKVTARDIASVDSASLSAGRAAISEIPVGTPTSEKANYIKQLSEENSWSNEVTTNLLASLRSTSGEQSNAAAEANVQDLRNTAAEAGIKLNSDLRLQQDKYRLQVKKDKGSTKPGKHPGVIDPRVIETIYDQQGDIVGFDSDDQEDVMNLATKLQRESGINVPSKVLSDYVDSATTDNKFNPDVFKNNMQSYFESNGYSGSNKSTKTVSGGWSRNTNKGIPPTNEEIIRSMGYNSKF